MQRGVYSKKWCKEVGYITRDILSPFSNPSRAGTGIIPQQQGRCQVEIRSLQTPFTALQHEERRILFERYLEGTLEAYDNTKGNTWFVEAVRHRIENSHFIVEATVAEGFRAGYIGVDNFKIAGVGLIAYVGIATVFPMFKKQGIMQYLLGSLEGYDGVMIRTQNPCILFSMYQVYGDVMPITSKPTLAARHCAKALAEQSGGLYDEESFVSKGIYNGRRLTGKENFSGRKWADDAIKERLDAEKGDAQILVSLFKRPRISGF